MFHRFQKLSDLSESLMNIVYQQIKSFRGRLVEGLCEHLVYCVLYFLIVCHAALP